MSVILNKNKCILYVIFLIILEPPIFYHYKIHIVYKAFQVLLMLLSGYFMISKKIYKNKVIFFLILYIFWNIFTTLLLNPTYVIKRIFDMLYLISNPVIVFYFIEKGNYKIIVRVLSNILAVYSIINTITYILYPNGIIYDTLARRNFYFLGMDNQFCWFMIPAIVILFIDIYVNKRKIVFPLIVCCMNLYIVFLAWSATAVVICFITVLLCLINYVFSIDSKILKNGLQMLFVISFIFFNVIQNLNIGFIDEFITKFLGKTLTFSGRTELWKQAISMIEQSPIIGYGAHENGAVLFENSIATHNIILQIAVESGILAVILLFYIFKISSKSTGNLKLINQYYIAIFSIMSSMLMEVYDLNFLMIFLILLYNVTKLMDEMRNLNGIK